MVETLELEAGGQAERRAEEALGNVRGGFECNVV